MTTETATVPGERAPAIEIRIPIGPAKKSTRVAFKIGLGVVGAMLIGVGVLMAASGASKVFPTTPVIGSFRTGFLTNEVLQIRNTSDKYLTNVNVLAMNQRTNAQASVMIGNLKPDQLVELGGLEWDWHIAAGDVYEVRADGYRAMTFKRQEPQR